ncbi:hypothetical protein KBZ10_07505 [Streptomyces sp. F63]|uniref:DUF6571 family protein n=1 Tax=Streptomyces sp. F63 TaxID=2824887 RepID=UPI001B36A7C0|nr:DUF6571 family protein [Streptomyces sp. F63]MBQ0984367.1 hypothetical protein [Streptomyces sp. F63]
MDFEALHSANFSTLDSAVKSWNGVVGKLETLEKDAREGLRGKANKADWSGYNATVSREFIGKTAGEFEDAHTQATSIRNIVRDTRDELKLQQSKLLKAIARGRDNHLLVQPKGGGFTVEDPENKAAGGQTAVDALRDELQGILNKATEIDTTAATALKALVDLTDYGFSGAEYKDRDAAAAAVKEAEKLAALAKKNPEDLSVAEFDALNAGLKKYSGDEIFAEHFASTLGARGTLEFWAGINDPYRGREVGQERHDQLDDLQKHLGLTLATATQADTVEMATWKREMTDLGDQRVGKTGYTMGFQVMSNLMRWGNYEDRFLTDYGTELINTEKKLSDNGRHMPTGWAPMGMAPLNRTGTDSGWDPMTGFMKALANSPGAATDFFNDTFVTKDEDHDFMTKNKEGKEVRDELSNFEYLFEERDWPPERDSEGEESIAGRNNLAMALEAATTGHPAGEMPTADTPAHNAGQTKLVESIFASVSENPNRLTDHGYMSDSLGQIASEYLPDMNRAMANDPSNKIQQLFPVAGSAADLNHREVTRFLVTIGQNPEAYAAVEAGQKSYMGNLLDYHLNPDLPEDSRYVSSQQLTVEEITHASGEISGTLSIGRQEAVAGAADQSDKDYANAMTQLKGAISGGVGIGIGVGTTFIASPVAGAVAGGAASTVSGAVLEQLFKDAEGDAKSAAGQEMGKHWENGIDRNTEYSQKAVSDAIKAHGLELPDAHAWARVGSRDGFLAAGTNTKAMGPDLTTDI